MLVESSTDAILMLDRERKIVSSNQAFLNLFGYDKNELDGRSIRIIHQSDESFSSFGEAAYPVIEKVGSIRKEWDFRRKDGTVFPVETVTSATKSSDGSIRGYVCIIRGITKRRKVEEKLKASEARFRGLFDNMSSGVAVYEAKDNGNDFIFKDFNKAGEAIDNTEKKNL